MRTKLGQIIGFTVDPEVSIEELKTMLEEEGAIDLVSEVEKIIAESKQVKTDQEQRAFFTKDLSEISDNRGVGTIYAVDYENDSEVNQVERIFAHRDMRVERNEVKWILPEEDAKRHQKNPVPHHLYPNSKFVAPVYSRYPYLPPSTIPEKEDSVPGKKLGSEISPQPGVNDSIPVFED